jgi:cytoskeletal protein CcmA (bactofilin family)
MFAKNAPQGGISNKDAETIIGASVKVEGNFVCEGDMIVDGEVKGKIATNGFLQVGGRSLIKADVKAGNGKISGEVRGNVKVDGYLELTASAKIYGDIDVQSLSIEKGAVLNGRCTMTAAPTQAVAEDEADEEAAEA